MSRWSERVRSKRAPHPEVQAIAERANSLMLAKGYTPWRIMVEAEKLGHTVSLTAVQTLISGATPNPGLRTIACVATGLGVPLGLLLGVTAEGFLHPVAFRTAAFLHEELSYWKRDESHQ